MAQHQNEKHTITQSIVLHLLPGVLSGAVYFLLRQPVQNLGYPSVFTLMLAAAFIFIPIELGYLLYKGKQAHGTYTLAGMIRYRDYVPWWQVLLWSLAVIVATGVIFTILKPVETILQDSVFSWVPLMTSGLDGSYTRPVLMVTTTSVLIIGVLIGPLVEELYFRGYLLPRTPGKYAAVLHSFLFAAYHVFTPWMILTRTLGVLPLIYAVKRKNIYVGIIAHAVMNSLDVVAAVIFIVNMT